MIDDRTQKRNWPLPHPTNSLDEDVFRLRTALSMIDASIDTVFALLASDDINLDTVQEIVGVLKAAQGNIGSITTVLATKADKTTTDAIQLTKADLATVRNMIAAGLIGWDYSTAGGTATQPAQIFYKSGAEWIKVALTWGTAGGESGNVTTAIYRYSSNAGVAYTTIGTKTMSYDSAGNVTAATWS